MTVLKKILPRPMTIRTSATRCPNSSSSRTTSTSSRRKPPLMPSSARRRPTYDLTILDVGLPDMDGRELCRILRKQGMKCPVVILTGHDSDADTILGLDAGANDYVTKPFKFPVLLARIRAQLRQHEFTEDAMFAIGEFTFKPSFKTLTDEGGRRIRLTEKGNRDPEAALPRRGQRRPAGHPSLRRLGIRIECLDPHARDAHLPVAQEDRDRSLEPEPAGHRSRRIQVVAVTAHLPRATRSRSAPVAHMDLRFHTWKIAGAAPGSGP